MKLALQSAAFAALLGVTFLCLRAFYSFDRIDAEVTATATQISYTNIAAIRALGAIQRTAATARQEIEGSQQFLHGHMDGELEFLNWLAMKRTGRVVYELDRVADSTVTLGDSAAATSQSVEETKNSIVKLADGIRMGYFECPGLGCSQSRFLAINGEAMRTLDATRRTAETISQTAPEFTTHVNGIAGDVHRYVDAFTRPKPWYKQGSTVGKIGIGLCRLLC